MPTQFSKINPVESGVLVCVDEAKDHYKYIRIDNVKMMNGHKLSNVLAEKDSKIKTLEGRVFALEKKMKAVAEIEGQRAESEDF